MGAIARVEFTVLGTVGATVDGKPVPRGTRKEHMLLALLLVHVNHTVTSDQIVEALWEDDAPAKPATSIRAYVSNIRRSLAVAGDDPKAVLVTQPGGYRLVAERASLDAHRFEDAVSAVITDGAGLGDDEQAARLDVALADAKGEPFAEFVYEDFAMVEAARLAELVLVARERRCELAVRLGDSPAWLPTISALVAMHPMRERLRAAHMRSLVDTGRHGEALRSFADHRTHLIEEMGIEPGPELRALEQEILALDEVERTSSGPARVRLAGELPDSQSDDAAIAFSSTGPAERRQVTSIAIVRRSTDSGSADPEELEKTVSEARRRWRTIVEAHAATTEDIPGGVLAHVGYPIARERDAERAVRAALAVVAHDLQCAVGVATGAMLATPSGDGASLTGDVPATAMQLAFAAAPGSVATTEVTRRLSSGHIQFEERDGQTIAVRVEVAPTGHHLPELVGREEELALARRVVAEARDGQGRVLVVTGEAGIGKTTLLDHLATDFGAPALRFMGSPFHADTAFWPVVAAMETHPGLDVPEVLAEWSREGDEALARMAPDPAKRRTILLEAALDAILDHADAQPTMCVFDDVQSMDASSVELISSLIDAAPTSALLVVVAIRGSDPSGLADVGHATTVGLGPLTETTARSLVRQVAGESLPDATESFIVQRGAGVPLFIEEMTQAVARASVGESGIEFPPPIPESIHDLLMARLDAVATARATIHLAAVAGDGFTDQLLMSVGDDDPTRVNADLTSLCEAGILLRERRPVASYRFRHGLILETAYQAVPRTRRAELHKRMALALLEQDPGMADTTAEVLARHHEAAGDLPEALRAWLRAANSALAVSALSEASEATRRGLAVADRLDGPAGGLAMETVVDLWLARGVVVAQQSGPASRAAIAIYDHLLDELGDSLNGAQRFRARWGRWYAMSTGWNVNEALSAAKEVHQAAVESGDTALLIEGHHVMWATCLTAGEFEEALEHTNQASVLYERGAHHWLTYEFGGHDPGVCMHSAAGLANWILGEPEQARIGLVEATRLGDELGHAYSRLEASFGPVTVAVLTGDVGVLRAEADALDQFADSAGLPPGARGYVDACRGVAKVAEGDLREGLAMLEDAASTWPDLWGSYCLPFDTELATALTALGRGDEALVRLDSILGVEARGRWWDSELRRVRGELFAQLGEQTDALAEVRHAIEVAQSQRAAALERRAQRSLASITSPSAG